MKKKLKAELVNSLKEKNKLKAATIRAIMSAVQYEEMQKKTEDLPEQAVIAIIKNEKKKRLESIEFEVKAGRDEEKAKLEEEISILNVFLPEELSEEKLREIISEIVNSNPNCNMGLIMKELKSKYSGQYDGKLASSIAKELSE